MICPKCNVALEPLIPLTNGGAMRVDPHDYFALVRHVWYRVRRKGTYYAEANVDGHTVMAHRAIMNPPPGLVVDHINGDGLDNRRANLRLCTQGENARNVSARPGTSKFKGVSRRDGKWRARIMVNRREISLGRFDSEVEAARAYDAAAVRHFGSFAKLNFGPAPTQEDRDAA